MPAAVSFHTCSAVDDRARTTEQYEENLFAANITSSTPFELEGMSSVRGIDTTNLFTLDCFPSSIFAISSCPDSNSSQSDSFALPSGWIDEENLLDRGACKAFKLGAMLSNLPILTSSTSASTAIRVVADDTPLECSDRACQTEILTTTAEEFVNNRESADLSSSCSRVKDLLSMVLMPPCEVDGSNFLSYCTLAETAEGHDGQDLTGAVDCFAEDERRASTMLASEHLSSSLCTLKADSSHCSHFSLRQHRVSSCSSFSNGFESSCWRDQNTTRMEEAASSSVCVVSPKSAALSDAADLLVSNFVSSTVFMRFERASMLCFVPEEAQPLEEMVTSDNSILLNTTGEETRRLSLSAQPATAEGGAEPCSSSRSDSSLAQDFTQEIRPMCSEDHVLHCYLPTVGLNVLATSLFSAPSDSSTTGDTNCSPFYLSSSMAVGTLVSADCEQENAKTDNHTCESKNINEIGHTCAEDDFETCSALMSKTMSSSTYQCDKESYGGCLMSNVASPLISPRSTCMCPFPSFSGFVSRGHCAAVSPSASTSSSSPHSNLATPSSVAGYSRSSTFDTRSTRHASRSTLNGAHVAKATPRRDEADPCFATQREDWQQ